MKMIETKQQAFERLQKNKLDFCPDCKTKLNWSDFVSNMLVCPSCGFGVLLQNRGVSEEIPPLCPFCNRETYSSSDLLLTKEARERFGENESDDYSCIYCEEDFKVIKE